MSFKRVLISATVTLGAFMAVGYTACTKTSDSYDDKCKTVVCQNDGVCFKGECSCSAGYSGKNCENKWQTRFLGAWELTAWVYNSNNAANIGDTLVYTVNVVPDSTGALMTMENFNGIPGAKVTCNIGFPKVDGKYDPASFVFMLDQKLAATGFILKDGKGKANDIGTIMGGTYILQYPDTVFGSYVTDSINFAGAYKN